MDPSEIPASPCYSSDSTTECETEASWDIELSPGDQASCCEHYHSRGIIDQLKDEELFCLFQACKRHKYTLFWEHGSVLPAESAFRMEEGEARLAQRLTMSGASPPKAHGHDKLTVQAGVHTGKGDFVSQLGPTLCKTRGGKLPRDSSEQSYPKFFVSVLDASTLEDATNNFSFEDFPEAPSPAQHSAEDSDQEWQRKLEAAEALLILRESFRGPSDTVSTLQPCVAPDPAGDRGVQPSSPSLQSKSASSVYLPVGHLGCVPLLS